MKKLLLVSTSLLLMYSCSTSKLVTKSSNAKDPVIEASHNGIVSRPLMADVSVENVRKEVTYIAPVYLSSTDQKSNAHQLFLETHNCDFIVDPVYTTTITKENKVDKEITIRLTGLPAKYTKFYQVDSIPKSVQQFKLLENPIARKSYINSIDETITQPKLGIDLNSGLNGLLGFQIDYEINSKMRSYVSYENLRTISPNFNFEINDTASTSGIPNTSSSFSFGLMKQFPVSNRLNFRAQGGLNVNMFDGVNAASQYGEILGFSQVGLRVLGGVDFKLSKGLFLILKGHTNFNLANIYSFDPIGTSSMKVTKFEANDLPKFYLGYGIRFEF